MELHQIREHLERINGCTFASLDAVTTPTPGVRRVIRNENVILFSNRHGSGYEAMVKRRLKALGKDPESFVLGDLPWGEREPETPIIHHKGRHYLQTILISDGLVETYVGDRLVDNRELPWLKDRDFPGPGQGLPVDNRVVCRTYRIENLSRLRILGDEIKGESVLDRPVLSMRDVSWRSGTG